MLLIDERPEEATRWRGAARRPAGDRHRRDAPARAAAAGRAARSPAPAASPSPAPTSCCWSTRSRGSPSRAATPPRQAIFRRRARAPRTRLGSLTVVATVLDGGEADRAPGASRRRRTRLIDARPGAGRGGRLPGDSTSPPPVSAARMRCATPTELEAARRLRAELTELPAREAAAKLRERIESATNAELAGL